MGPVRIFADGFLLSLSLCADLGVVNMAAIRLGLAHGARAALYLGMGSCVADLVYGLGSLSLVSLLAEHRGVRLFLWIVGSGVLLWLAVRMLRETLHPRDLTLLEGAPDDLRAEREFGRGAMLALSSPSAILWFAGVGGSVIAAHAESRYALLPFFGGFFVAGALWTFMIAAITGYAHRRLGPGFVRALSLMSALLFGYFAITVFIHGYGEFVGKEPLTDR